MSLGPPGAQLDPEQAENFEDMEKQFAVKAVQHLEIYWALLENKRGSEMHLTKIDDEIYDNMKKELPDFDPATPINEDEMKSKEGKERWRDFVMQYKGRIDDFDFGTMLRADPKDEYTEKNTIFAVRMQFYAVEIARNRAGLNDWVYEKKHKS